MGERLNGIQEVGGSSPLRSTLMGRIGVIGADKGGERSGGVYTLLRKVNMTSIRSPIDSIIRDVDMKELCEVWFRSFKMESKNIWE